jgi:hypothetical protein
MAQKLYKATVEMTYYFLAEEGRQQGEAESWMEDAIRDDSLLRPDVEEVNSYNDTTDWEPDTLIYGPHCNYGPNQRDIKLREAFGLSTGKDFDEEKEKVMQGYREAAKRAGIGG